MSAKQWTVYLKLKLEYKTMQKMIKNTLAFLVLYKRL